jgi:hypothetical protein
VDENIEGVRLPHSKIDLVVSHMQTQHSWLVVVVVVVATTHLVPQQSRDF